MTNASGADKKRLHSMAASRWLDTPDRLRLRAGRWEPTRFPKATVVLLQGRGEFIEKYDEIASEFTKREIRVLTLDWRGQGKSSRLLRNPQRFHVKHYNDYVEDMKLFMNGMVRFATEGKLFIFAQSMGALIALHYLLKYPANIEGLLLFSPLADLYTGPYSRRTTQAMSYFACSTGFSDAYAFTQQNYGPHDQVFENNPLTTDPEQFKRMHQWYMQEPSLQVGGVTFGWLNSTFQAIDGLNQADLSSIQAEKLIFSAPDDRIVPFLAQQRLGSRLTKCHLKTYTGAGHEIFFEKEALRKQLWKDIDDFMKVRIPNYVGGGTDRVRPDIKANPNPPKMTPWNYGSGGGF